MTRLTLSDGTQVDPQTLDSNQPDAGVYKLMKVIKGLEGGDYNDRSGDGGSSAGAYQWNNNMKPLRPGELPANWKNASAQYLKDANAPMTPENQNYVAYRQMKNYKDQGKSPEEIDALWNGARKGTDGKYTHVSSARQKKFREAALGGQNDEGFVTSSNVPKDIQPPTPDETKPKGFWDQVKSGDLKGAGMTAVNNLASSFTGLAAIPVQAGVKAYNAVTGSNIADPYSKEGGNSSGLNVSPLTLEEKVRDLSNANKITGNVAMAGLGVKTLQYGARALGIGKSFLEGPALKTALTDAGYGTARDMRILSKLDAPGKLNYLTSVLKDASPSARIVINKAIEQVTPLAEKALGTAPGLVKKVISSMTRGLTGKAIMLGLGVEAKKVYDLLTGK